MSGSRERVGGMPAGPPLMIFLHGSLTAKITAAGDAVGLPPPYLEGMNANFANLAPRKR